MTLQIGKWYVLCGATILAGFVVIKLVASDALGLLSPASGIGLATAFIGAGIWAIRRANLSKALTITVTADAIAIDTGRRGRRFAVPLSDFKGVRTLHPSNPKADIQAEIVLRNRKVSLTSALDEDAKAGFDAFCRFCENVLGFVERDVPFSIWTHNWQGARYVEYANPDYR